MDAVVWKVARRTIPLLVALFIFNFMDRVNVGFAALEMNRDLGFSPVVYGFGAGLFFISYFLFEVPSNVALHRFGARIWIGRIAVSWGIVACLTAAIQGTASFYIMRFLLGVAEAGFYPGVVFYLMGWFPERDRARALALFQTGQAMAVIVGAPLSTWLLQVGWLGVPGWRWMFVLEGIPSILLGIAALMLLRNSPDEVSWLTTPERRWLVDRIAGERNAKPIDATVMGGIMDLRVVAYAAVYFTIVVAVIGMTLWLPQIVHSLGTSDPTRIGLLSAAPWLFGLVAQFALSTSSDRTGERKWHIGLAMLCCAATFAASALSASPVVSYLCIAVSLGGLFAVGSLFWTMPASLLGGVAAASGIAFINSTAMVGGFIGPFLIGWIRESTQSFAVALIAMAVILVGGASIVLTRRRGRDYLPAGGR